MKVTGTEIVFTWKERRNGISSLKRAKKLFAGGKNWTTGTFREELEDGTANFCSIGAVNEANGAGEPIAISALNCALHKGDFLSLEDLLDGGLYTDSFVIDFNDSLYEQTDYKLVSNLFDSAVKILKRGSYKLN